MTADEFWNGPPYLTKTYRKKHYLEVEQLNQQLWLQGLYFYNAVAAVISNALAKNGSRKTDYLKKPIDILPKTADQLKKEKEKEKEMAILELNAWKDSFNSNKAR